MLLYSKVPQGLCSHPRTSSEHLWATQVSAHHAVFRGPNEPNGQCHPNAGLWPGGSLSLPLLANLHLDWRNHHHCHGEADPVSVHIEWATETHKKMKDRKDLSSEGRFLEVDIGTVFVHLWDKGDRWRVGSKTRLRAFKVSEAAIKTSVWCLDCGLRCSAS